MAEIRYKIPILSVRALTAYAKEQSDEVYSYNLTKNETESVIQRGSETYQNENAIFYQAMNRPLRNSSKNTLPIPIGAQSARMLKSCRIMQ